MNPRVVALGGGHGLHATLSALRHVVDHPTAVVTVADNGGSSGRLRGEFGVLPPGDLRMALAALCGDDEWGQTWERVLQHRFAGDGEMRGHVVGNLLIVSLWELLGDHVAALQWVARLLGAQGTVLPMATTPMDITAEVRGLDPADPARTTTVRGQVEVATTDGEIVSISLDPADPVACPEAVAAVLGRRLGRARPGLVVLLGDPAPDGAGAAPGAWSRPRPGWSSSSTSRGRQGETHGYAPEDHLAALHEHAPDLTLHTVLVDPSTLTDAQTLEQAVASWGARLEVADVAVGDGSPRHDTRKLAAAFARILDDARAPEGAPEPAPRVPRRVIDGRGRIGPMAMTGQVKAELASTQITKTCCRKAEVATMLRFAGGLHIVSGRIVVEAELDTGAAARRLRKDIADVYGHPSDVVMVQGNGLRKGSRYIVRVVKDGEALARQTGLLDQRGRPVRGLPPTVVSGGSCDAVAAWRGAFLAHGSLTEPGRSSSMEVTCPGPEAALALVGVARRLGIQGKAREVRGVDRVVVRDGDAIGALLTRLGAHESLMAWEERRMRREVRATANRLANFDDANLRRSARAAVAAGARVERALEILADEVPDHLRMAGDLRLEHKQASLEELGQLHDPVLTKDAIAGRIRRLLAMADKRAEELGIPDTEASLTPEMLADEG